MKEVKFIWNTVNIKTSMFTFNKYTYDLFIRPWKKGKSRYEALRWLNGLRCTWERITIEEYKKRVLEYKQKVRKPDRVIKQVHLK